jgi:hypothetical protein
VTRRFASQPLTLTQPGDVAVSSPRPPPAASSAPVSRRWRSPRLARCGGQGRRRLGNRWVGDFSGLVIVTPIVLTLIGRPRGDWRRAASRSA